MITAQEPNDVMLVAGGTDVYPNMKRQQYEPKTLIGLRQLGILRTLTGNARHGLSIGAGMTLTQAAQAIHPHPTQTEMFGELARKLLTRLHRTAVKNPVKA